MLSNTVKNVSANPISGKYKVDDNITQNNSESSPLTSDIKFVSNSAQELFIQKNTSKPLTDGFLTHVWRSLQVSDGKHSNGNISDKEESELTDILTLGETLRQQANSLSVSNNEVLAPQSWKGSVLKRCLIGVGLLTGTGLLSGAGYKYYNARAAHAGTPGKGLQQGSLHTTLEAVKMQQSYGGSLEDPFGHHDASTNKARHNRRHQPEFAYRTIEPRLNNGGSKNNIKNTLQKTNLRVKKLLYRAKLLSDRAPNTKEKMLYAVSLYLNYNNTDINKGNNIELLAQKILSGSGIYGEHKNEKLSSERAKSVVRHWIFQNILGTTPEKYIESKIKMDMSKIYTVGDIHRLLSVDTLPVFSSFHPELLRQFEQLFLSMMWKNLLIEEMPFLTFSDKKIISMPLNDFDFANLYSGSRFIKDIKGENITLEDTISTGKSMWDLAITEGISEEKSIYYYAPIILFYATHSSGGTANEHMNDIINNYINYRVKINTIKKDIHEKYNTYFSATKFWLPKNALADDIIAHCPNLKQFFSDRVNAALTPEQRQEKSKKSAKQYYLNNWAKPCAFAPDNIDDEYTQLTTNVANSFHDIDKYLILSAISQLSEDDKIFISSPEASIHLVGVILNNNRRYGGYLGHDTRVVLGEKTDLFSVNISKQERIYALQATKNNQVAYRLIRVDRNIQQYIENDIFDSNYHEGFFINTVYKPSDKINFEDFYLINKELYISSDNDNIKLLIDELTDRHRLALFNSLYTSGNNNSDLAKVWSVAKHLIPFYDCVEQNIKGNHAEAAVACFMDLISLTPVLGQSAKLGGEFIQGSVRGFSIGAINLGKEGVKVTGKNILRKIILPTTAEISSLGKNTIMALDPGFSLLMSASSISRNFAEKVVNLIFSKKEMAALAKNLDTRIARLPLITPGKQVTGILPGTELEVPVVVISRKNEKDIYVRINSETGEKFGTKYTCLHNGILASVSSITSRILKRNIRSDENMYMRRLINTDEHHTRRMKRTENKSNLCSDQPSTSKASRTIMNSNQEITDVNSIPLLREFLSPLKTHLPLTPRYIKKGRKRIPIADLHLANDCSITGAKIKSSIIKKYGKNNIFIYRYNNNIEEIPKQFAQLKNNIPQFKEEILLAKKFVDSLDSEFQLIEKQKTGGRLQSNLSLLQVENYLSKMLKLETIKDAQIVLLIKKEAINRLKFHIRKMKSYFDNEINSIYFASANTDPLSHPSGYGKTVAFVHVHDIHRRIIVMADYLGPSEIFTQLYTTILHELSHLSGTSDFYVNGHISPTDSLQNFNDAALGVDNQYITFSYSFLKNYRESTHLNVNEAQLIEIIKRDPALRANAFIENADFLANIIADLATSIHNTGSFLSRKMR